MKIIDKINVKINRRRLKKRISKKPQKWLDDIIEECLKECNPEPKGIYSFFNCGADIKNNVIKVEDKSFYSKFLTERFKCDKEVGLFIVTVGLDLEERSREAFNEGEGVKGFVYDCIGSEYAESTADALHKLLEKEKGYPMSRFSPGYNDWDISEQSKLFQLIPGSKIGVNLNKSYLMKPVKSVSAMIGFSDKELKNCGICSKSDCKYRM